MSVRGPVLSVLILLSIAVVATPAEAACTYQDTPAGNASVCDFDDDGVPDYVFVNDAAGATHVAVGVQQVGVGVGAIVWEPYTYAGTGAVCVPGGAGCSYFWTGAGVHTGEGSYVVFVEKVGGNDARLCVFTPTGTSCTPIG